VPHVSPSMPTQADAEPLGELGVGTVKVPVTAVNVPYEDGKVSSCSQFYDWMTITNSGVGIPDGARPVRAVLYMGRVGVRGRVESLQGSGPAVTSTGLFKSRRSCENSSGDQSANEQGREDHVEQDVKTGVTL
jgi:hypothetical protein